MNATRRSIGQGSAVPQPSPGLGVNGDGTDDAHRTSPLFPLFFSFSCASAIPEAPQARLAGREHTACRTHSNFGTIRSCRECFAKFIGQENNIRVSKFGRLRDDDYDNKSSIKKLFSSMFVQKVQESSVSDKLCDEKVAVKSGERRRGKSMS